MQYSGVYPNATKVPVEVAPAATTTTATVLSGAPATPPARTGEVAGAPLNTAPPATTTTQPTVKIAAPPVVVSKNPEPIIVQAEQFPPHPDKQYIEIAYDAVKQLHDKGALFLDARRTSVYEQGHIAGARPFSVWESDIDQKVNKLFEERSDPREQAQPIVVYCSGGECEDSHMLAQKLWGIQFNNVYVYKDGFPDWQKRGGAVHTGANP